MQNDTAHNMQMHVVLKIVYISASKIQAGYPVESKMKIIQEKRKKNL